MWCHRDPVFDAVAAKEEADQRTARRDAEKADRDRAWRSSDEYRRIRQNRIRAVMRRVLKK